MKSHKQPVGPAAVKEYQRQISPKFKKDAEAKQRELLAKKTKVKIKPTSRTTNK